MESEGLSTEEARKRIWMLDRYGLVTVNRPTGHLDEHKGLYAKKARHIEASNLDEIIDLVKPTCLIGN